MHAILIRVFLVLALTLSSAAASQAAEDGETAGFLFVQDGYYTEKLDIPTYEWIPQHHKTRPRGIVVFVHGLTMHGQRYTRLAEVFSSKNFYCVSWDMCGYGRCYRDPEKKFQKGFPPNRWVDYKKSYENLIEILKMARERCPDTPVYIVGESLGGTMTLKMALHHAELIDYMILSGPALRLNPFSMYNPFNIATGFIGSFNRRLDYCVGYYVRHALSGDKDVRKDIKQDKLIRTKISWPDLVTTQTYIPKSVYYARKINENPSKKLPVLMIHGSKDKVVSRMDIALIKRYFEPEFLTFKRLRGQGHLLLETSCLREVVLKEIFDWVDKQETHRALAAQQPPS